jgi:TPR repeat protein
MLATLSLGCALSGLALAPLRPSDPGDLGKEITTYLLAGPHSDLYVLKRAPERFAAWRGAADKGSAEGRWLVARCYALGAGVTRDDKEAVRWCQRAADQGFALAQETLGPFHLTGVAGPPDEAAALKFFRQAADKGLATAMDRVGAMLAAGRGAPRDAKEAQAWYKKGFEAHHRAAGLGGDPVAMYSLAMSYSFGRGVTASDTEAFKWLLQSAEKGVASAQNDVAVRYNTAKGTEKKPAEAVKWYRKASEQGHGLAALNLARTLTRGPEEIRNKEEGERFLAVALERFRKGAERDDTQALYYLAQLHAAGEGVKKDEAEALRLYHRSAERDFNRAQYALGDFYEKGRAGLKPDPDEALKWYRKAAAQGNAQAKARLAVLDSPKP